MNIDVCVHTDTMYVCMCLMSMCANYIEGNSPLGHNNNSLHLGGTLEYPNTFFIFSLETQGLVFSKTLLKTLFKGNFILHS